jgi:hypothetical protein
LILRVTAQSFQQVLGELLGLLPYQGIALAMPQVLQNQMPL